MYNELSELLDDIACKFGHERIREYICGWQEGYTLASHLAFIQDLADSLQERFSLEDGIESLPPRERGKHYK